MEVEEFIKTHFKGIEKETWYPAIAAIAEGYAKHKLEAKDAEMGELDSKILKFTYFTHLVKNTIDNCPVYFIGKRSIWDGYRQLLPEETDNKIWE